MKNADKPINPVMMQQVGENEFRASKPSDQKEWNIPTEVLTKREHYAGLAMQGLLALPDKGTYNSFDEAIERICEVSIKFADELLKQLENK